MWEKLTSKAGSMQGTWVSTVLRLGGGGPQARGSRNPVPSPKAELGQRPNLAAEKHGSVEKREVGSSRQGPPGPLR